MFADPYCMTTPFRARRRRDDAEPFQVVSWSQHWRRIDGRWYRDAVARCAADGALHLVSFPDEEMAA